MFPMMSGPVRDSSDDRPVAGVGSETGSGVPRVVPEPAAPNGVTGSMDESVAPMVSDLDAPPTADSMAALLGQVARAPAQAPPVELAEGTIVDGTYKITGTIGGGGMGVVYLARDLDLQRDVALKIHRAAHGLDRLQREAIAMAQLAHPNVLTVHAVGAIERRVYVAMEYVPGQTFRTWCEEKKRGWREILAMLLAAGEGLAAAHDAGFVHRDFKPENVLVGKDGRPRVGDFGLVRASVDMLQSNDPISSRDGAPVRAKKPTEPGRPLESSDALAETIDASSSGVGAVLGGGVSERAALSSPISASLTVTGAALGTPAYMAPEQFAGGAVDARADQFAFCIVLHEALCGKRPFRGKTYGELRDQVTKHDPDPLPRGAAPSWLARAIRRGLARDPADRWPDLRALLAELRAGPRRRARLALAGGATAIAAVAAAFLALQPSHVVAPAQSCDRAGAGLDDTWTPDRRAAVIAHVSGLDPRIGAAHAERIASAFDQFRDRFAKVATDGCRARIDHSWSPRTVAQHNTCLGGAASDFRHAVDQVSTIGRDRLPLTAGEIAALPRIEDCAEERVLLAEYQVPADPDTARKSAELRARLEAVDDLEGNDDTAKARAALDELMPEIEALGFAPLTASALVTDGLLLRAEQKPELAVDRFERAYASARAAGADGIALHAVYWLIWTQGVEGHDVAAARPWVVQSVPEAERYGLDHVRALRVLQAAAVMAEIDADYDRAIALHRRVVAAREGSPDIVLATALGNYGATLEAAGQPKEAIEIYERALSIIEGEFSSEDRRTNWIRNNLILAQVGVGEAAKAVETADAALAIATKTANPEPQDILNLRFNRAYALQSADRLEEALVAYNEVRGDQVAHTGEDSVDVAYIDANLGDTLADLHRYEEARAPLERALKIRRKAYGEDHDEVADVYTHLAGVELRTRGCAHAAPLYEKALASYLAVQERGGAEITRAGGAHYGLGHCKHLAGKDVEARRLLERARELAERGHDTPTLEAATKLLAELDRAR
jgi:eukaryotic-like serine/threonine-protein kinase